MNEDAIRELIDFMKKCRYGFNMRTSENRIDMKNRCGTAGCIAGHAALLWPEMRVDFSSPDGTMLMFVCRYGLLEDKLQISKEKFYRLIDPTETRDGVSSRSYDINKYWAIRTLEHLLNTGEVAWQTTRSPA